MQPAKHLANVIIAAACLIVCLPIACSKDEPDTAEISDVDQAKVNAKLAAWDELDGKKDKTIEKCAGCALAMDGKADHAFKASGYSMHFCSKHCRDNYSTDTAKKILAQKTP